MDIFDGLTALGGLCLFLFGMQIMAEALQRRAGGRLEGLLRRMTRSRWAGFFTGLAVTAAVQSSSAAMVMVVGFVNSGMLTLRQAVGVIMGTNVGTTVTPWLLSLGGLEGGGVLGRLLRPAGFVPLLSLWGIAAYLAGKGSRRDTGQALLGFAVLMQGMEIMTAAVSGLARAEGFRQLFTAFGSPLLGVLAGAVLTAVIQSSSASVGILQALAASGQVTVGAAIPIVMGQNIGTWCIGAGMITHRLRPDAAICIDVTHATDSPGLDKGKFGDIKLGGGPAVIHGTANHPNLVARLEIVADKNKIPLQHEAAGRRTGTDTDSIYVSRDGVASALVSVPLRYMHSPVETASLTDVENTIKLLLELVKSLTPGDFFGHKL